VLMPLLALTGFAVAVIGLSALRLARR
jgi:hypothetical protein